MTQQELKKHLHYNQDTGIFTWRKSTTSYVKNGSIAGNSNKVHKYIDIRLKKEKHKAHRLAWLYIYGVMPNGEIDHINHIKTDNRILNLRVVSRHENLKNKPKQKNNTSGVTGVLWAKREQKWVARIKVNCKDNHLGYFHDKEDAINARNAANVKYNYHVNHGI